MKIKPLRCGSRRNGTLQDWPFSDEAPGTSRIISKYNWILYVFQKVTANLITSPTWRNTSMTNTTREHITRNSPLQNVSRHILFLLHIEKIRWTKDERRQTEKKTKMGWLLWSDNCNQSTCIYVRELESLHTNQWLWYYQESQCYTKPCGSRLCMVVWWPQC